MARASDRMDVMIEIGARRTFARAIDWPGLARGARTPELAIEALLAALPRYREVARHAAVPLPTTTPTITIVEEIPGNATTDFGAPAAIAAADHRPVTTAQAAREAALLRAAWATLDDTASTAPEHLRKGPRGGGRDTSAVLAHVLEVEPAYARKLGISGRHDLRPRILEVLGRPSNGQPVTATGWPARYACARITWHALDHAWEIADRSD